MSGKLSSTEIDALRILCAGKARRTNLKSFAGHVNRRALHVLGRRGYARLLGGGWYEATEEGRRAYATRWPFGVAR